MCEVRGLGRPYPLTGICGDATGCSQLPSNRSCKALSRNTLSELLCRGSPGVGVAASWGWSLLIMSVTGISAASALTDTLSLECIAANAAESCLRTPALGGAVGGAVGGADDDDNNCWYFLSDQTALW